MSQAIVSTFLISSEKAAPFGWFSLKNNILKNDLALSAITDSKPQFWTNISYFIFGTPSGVYLFGHLLWPIFQLFQSSITHYNYNFFNFLLIIPFLSELIILALARIWTLDLPSDKPICYQLSYPGLDIFSTNIW